MVALKLEITLAPANKIDSMLSCIRACTGAVKYSDIQLCSGQWFASWDMTGGRRGRREEGKGIIDLRMHYKN